MAGDNFIDLSAVSTFHLPWAAGLRDVAEQIGRMDPDGFREASAFAFMSGDALSFEATGAESARAYASGKPILIVDRSNGVERIWIVREDRLEPFSQPGAVERVREADFLDLMYADGACCAMEPSGNYHFVTPSQIHTNRFLRIGDLVRNLPTLDRITYWIERLVFSVDALLIDSWSIASIGLRVLQKLRCDIPFDCLPEHPTHNRSGCKAVIDKITNQLSEGSKLLVVISISSSGRLQDQLACMINEVSSERFCTSFISLYGFSDATPTDIECIARIDNGVTLYEEKDCQLCKENSAPIPIDPSSYHLRVWREHTVFTAERHFDPGRRFFETYQKEEDIFFVHRNDSTDQRHHAFDIDVGGLMKVQCFLNALGRLLERFRDRKDLVICPNHSVAIALGEMTRKVLGIDLLIHDNLYRNRMQAEHIDRVRRARNLLIVDDAFNSGSRLHSYVRSLRDETFDGFDTVDLLVGLARPETEASFKIVSKSIADRHCWKGELHFVEKVLLPRWGAHRCPWCLEFDLLSRLEQAYARPPEWLTSRTQLLRSREKGIACDAFFTLSGISSPRLAAESRICKEGASPTVLTHAVASGLQQHRSDPGDEKRLHPDFPLANVMDPDNFKERYTEGSVRAALLRTLSRQELGTSSSRATLAILLREMRCVGQEVLSGEVIAALGRRSLPVISAVDFGEHFKGLLSASDIHEIASALNLPG